MTMKTGLAPALVKRTALLLLLSTLNFQPSIASAQGTAFSYQGRLNDGASPANGNYDLAFTLYAANAGGAPIAGPLTNAATAVNNGLFTVTLDFGANFPGTDRWLEISVQKNGAGFTTLSPRQHLTAAPYSITAGNVTGSVSASQLTGTILPSNIGAGTITSNDLASGAAAANLAASGQSGVGSGGLILSPTDNNSALLNAGYVKFGTTQLGDSWLPGNTGGAPVPRQLHTAVWTGSEMIVWGGFNGAGLSDGGRYNPVANTWIAVPVAGAPVARYNHTAVWTGTEMIVWGGNNGATLNDGGRYNPAANSWTAISNNLPNTPAGRQLHAVVWTGSQMIVWGG